METTSNQLPKTDPMKDDEALFVWENTNMRVRTYSDLSKPPKSVKQVCNSRNQTLLVRPYIEKFGSYKLMVYWWAKQEWHWQIWTPQPDAHIVWSVSDGGEETNAKLAKQAALKAAISRPDLTELERVRLKKCLEDLS